MPLNLNKKELKELYQHIPRDTKRRILLQTKYFDRIGPIALPCEINKSVVNLTLYYFISHNSNQQYFLVTKNSSLQFTNPFVRISSNCFYGFITNSKRCDCKWQFETALNLMNNQSDNDFVIIFSLDDHGKGIRGGLTGHAILYALGQNLNQELIYDAYEKNGFHFEERNYHDIHFILKSFSINKLRLLTNNPERVSFFKGLNYEVEQYSLEKPYDKYLSEELGMKRKKLGHVLKLKGFKKKDIEIYGLNIKSFEK